MKNIEAKKLNIGNWDELSGMFYVYLHRKASDLKVFYVGKGSKERAASKKGRNAHWKRVANKHGFIYEIVFYSKNEYCVFEKEKELIKFYGINNLTNITNGGDGRGRGFEVSDDVKKKISIALKGIKKPKRTELHAKKISESLKGRKMEPHVKEKISKSLKGIKKGGRVETFFHKDHGEFTGTCQELINKYGLDRNVTSLLSGRIKSTKGWSLLKNSGNIGHRKGIQHPLGDKKIYRFSNGDNFFIGTKYDFSNEKNIDIKYVSRIVRGDRLSVFGWKLS